MNIKLKLYAQLGKHLPEHAKANEADIVLEGDQTVRAVLDSYGVPEEMCHLVLVNGAYVEPENRTTRLLEENDQLAVWPPIAGG